MIDFCRGTTGERPVRPKDRSERAKPLRARELEWQVPVRGRSFGSHRTFLLDELARLRVESLGTLANWRLTDAQLALEGEHPAFGAVTPRQLVATRVAHDLGHIAQVARVMARHYREAVGPGRAYLPVVDR